MKLFNSNVLKTPPPRLSSPRVVKALLERPFFEDLESWLLIGKGKQFANVLKKHGKKPFTLEEKGTIIGPEQKRFPRSRHNRLKPINAVLLDSDNFTQEETRISVQADEKVLDILENLYGMGKLDNGKKPIYIAGVCFSSASSVFIRGPELVVNEVLVHPTGRIHVCRKDEKKTLNQRYTDV